MASIENRSRIKVTVRNREDLTKLFPFNADKAIRAHLEALRAQGFKPQLTSLDDHYVVRTRSVAHKNQTLIAHNAAEALELKLKLESEERQGLFIDYGSGQKTSFASLLVRYLREEAPRHKSFQVEGYKINALLADAGLPRQDLAQIVAEHPNPHPKVAAMKLRKPTNARMGRPSETSKFIRKPFATILPDDFTKYIDDRCQAVTAATVDREVDLFSAVCRLAINTWRIHVLKNPMDGVRRPRYYNERKRRISAAEETKLLNAAHNEDRKQSINLRLEQLIGETRQEANAAATIYRRKQIIKDARRRFMQEAEATYQHVALLETFIHFQLMTGARRGETLALTWPNVNFETKTAYLPDSKNGRARNLPLRQKLIDMLNALPRTGEHVFPIEVDALRKAWSRMCDEAGLSDLHVHDLRHEAISRVAEVARFMPGEFRRSDLNDFSGHQDDRMLLRYTHLPTTDLANRLDAAFANSAYSTVHRGVRRLKKGAPITLEELISVTAISQPANPPLEEEPNLLKHQPNSNIVHVDFARRYK